MNQYFPVEVSNMLVDQALRLLALDKESCDEVVLAQGLRVRPEFVPVTACPGRLSPASTIAGWMGGLGATASG